MRARAAAVLTIVLVALAWVAPARAAELPAVGQQAQATVETGVETVTAAAPAQTAQTVPAVTRAAETVDAVPVEAPPAVEPVVQAAASPGQPAPAAPAAAPDSAAHLAVSAPAQHRSAPERPERARTPAPAIGRRTPAEPAAASAPPREPVRADTSRASSTELPGPTDAPAARFDGAVASGLSTALSIGGLGLAAVAFCLSAPRLRRRLVIPAFAPRPQGFVLLLERPG